MAEWLGRGLQHLVRGFKSLRDLHICNAWVAELVDALVSNTNDSNIVSVRARPQVLHLITSMQQNEPAPLQQLIQKIIQRSPHQEKIQQASILNAWDTAMPDVVKKATKHIDVRKDNICIEVTSAPLRQELQASKDKILAALQKITTYPITDIIFTAKR